MEHVNFTLNGYSVRNYVPGDLYMDIYCPHGKPIETVNTGRTEQDARLTLEKFLAESKDWLTEYCYH